MLKWGLETDIDSLSNLKNISHESFIFNARSSFYSFCLELF